MLRLVQLCLRTQTVLLGTELRRELGTEIVGLENLAQFDFAFLEWTALKPFNGLFHRAQLPDPETGNELLGLGKRSVDHSALGSGEPHTLALRRRMQPFAGKHDTGFDQLLIEVAHVLQFLLARHGSSFGFWCRLNYYKKLHRSSPWLRCWSEARGSICRQIRFLRHTTNGGAQNRHPHNNFVPAVLPGIRHQR